MTKSASGVVGPLAPSADESAFEGSSVAPVDDTLDRRRHEHIALGDESDCR